jgi:hypothetical protein
MTLRETSSNSPEAFLPGEAQHQPDVGGVGLSIEYVHALYIFHAKVPIVTKSLTDTPNPAILIRSGLPGLAQTISICKGGGSLFAAIIVKA